MGRDIYKLSLGSVRDKHLLGISRPHLSHLHWAQRLNIYLYKNYGTGSADLLQMLSKHCCLARSACVISKGKRNRLRLRLRLRLGLGLGLLLRVKNAPIK